MNKLSKTISKSKSNGFYVVHVWAILYNNYIYACNKDIDILA